MSLISNKLKNFFFLCSALSLLASCVSIPGTGGKTAFIMIPPAQEQSLGSQSYQEILKKERLSTNRHWNAVLDRVGRRIAQVAESKHRVGYQWQFKLIESKQANAFCLPGGKVAFYTGILPYLQNEAAMAIVMGHEVAHATLRHGAQRMSRGMLAQTLMGLGAIGLQNNKYKNQIMAGLGVGTQVGVMLPFSRAHETESDVLGLEYAAKAGYDPREAARFWQRFGQSSKGAPPQFLSTHPASSSRVKKLRSLEQKALAWYQQSAQYGLGSKL